MKLGRNTTRMTKVWEVDTDSLMEAWYSEYAYKGKKPTVDELEIYMWECYVENNNIAPETTMVEVGF